MIKITIETDNDCSTDKITKSVFLEQLQVIPSATVSVFLNSIKAMLIKQSELFGEFNPDITNHNIKMLESINNDETKQTIDWWDKNLSRMVNIK